MSPSHERGTTVNPDTPRGTRTSGRPVKFKYRVTFRSGYGSEQVKVHIELYSVSEGNAAIHAANMLAKRDAWNCTSIERV